jgi:hypothetical protein
VSSEGSATAQATGTPLSLPRAAWGRWKKLAHAIGVVQTRLLMIAFFFVFAFPLGLVMRLTGDRLRLKPTGGSNWAPHPHHEQSIETARRQY